jgi:plasmid stabilization system protein ParE
MAFRVELAPQALADLDAIATHIAEQSSHSVAERWFNRMIDAIGTLTEMPERCTIAGESKELARQLRVLLVGPRNHAYKVYFDVVQSASDAGTVRVVHVRHWARRSPGTAELRDIVNEED